MEHATDLALVRRVLARDPQAIDEFVWHLRCIAGFVRSIDRRYGGVLDEHTQRDVVQDVIVSVWIKLGSYRGNAALRTWIYRFCDFRARTVARHLTSRRSTPLPSDLVDGYDTKVEVDAGQTVDQALRSLEPIDARIVRLKVLEGRTFVDLARELPWGPSTVKTRYYRALARLRRGLAVRGSRGEGAAPL